MRGNTRARAPQDVRIRTGRGTIAGYALRVATAAALVIDAVVHLKDAYFYDANAGALLTQGQLFRIQAVVAIVAALAVLAWPRWPSWLFAALVSASAAAAVVAYTYLDIGPIAGLPNMYEPSWGPPGKLVSAYAEGAGALLALAGLAYALARQRRAKAHAPAGKAPGERLEPAPHK
jgi:MYXO-CTERM domain-containing protein